MLTNYHMPFCSTCRKKKVQPVTLTGVSEEHGLNGYTAKMPKVWMG